MSQIPSDLISELSNLFSTRFKASELEDFAFAFNIDYEDLSGTERKAKALALAKHLWRYDLIPKLATIGPKERPDIDWYDLLGKYQVDDGNEEIGYNDRQKLILTLSKYPLFQTPEERHTLLKKAGIDEVVNTNLNKSTMLVASALLVQLIEHDKRGGGLILPSVDCYVI
jgi:hypothetical protein